MTGVQTCALPISTTLGVTRPGPSQIRLQLGGQPGRGYELQCSDDLATWTTADYLLLDNSGATNATITTTPARNFFRVR